MLANNSYDQMVAPGDTPELLNLSWTLDERRYLDVDMTALVSNLMHAEVAAESFSVDRYLVQDPYGTEHIKEALAAYFGVNTSAFDLSCGAGALSLLCGLSALAVTRPLYVIGETYPDLPHWVHLKGGLCVSGINPMNEIRHLRPSLVLLDRPSATDKRFDNLDSLLELCHTAGEAGSVCLIDESYGNYCAPGFSAVHLFPEVRNLIVIRGMSKAYWLGGLRLGFCIASTDLADIVREVIPPMLASSFSLHIGKEVLERGDIAGSLRQRITAARKETLTLLNAAGFPPPSDGCDLIPHLIIGDVHEGTTIQARLRDHGILTKRQPFWSGPAGEYVERARLAIPLDPARMSILRDRLGNAVT